MRHRENLHITVRADGKTSQVYQRILRPFIQRLTQQSQTRHKEQYGFTSSGNGFSNTQIDLRCFAVCSDSDVGKKNHDDNVVVGISDLKYPATTNANSLVKAFNQPDIFGSDKPPYMNVVFSTYHSVEVIHQAQKLGFPAFDFIICDEAHRTTGATFEGDDESAFVRIHDNAYIAGQKRLYMTATPRIFGDDAKETEGVTLCSMDDKSLYGDDLYVITFSKAVQLGILCDYKVIVLAVEE
ncbi:DEAD/DEAH box helicase family protein, partial [Escherichia sp. SP-MK2]